jgi:hypothetical protein
LAEQEKAGTALQRTKKRPFRLFTTKSFSYDYSKSNPTVSKARLAVEKSLLSVVAFMGEIESR